MRTFLIIFWGIFALLTTVATIYVLINYEVQRWKDKQRLREGIYIRRVTRLEALCLIFVPVPSVLMAFLHVYVEEEFGTGNEILYLCLSLAVLPLLRYVHVAYVKTSAEGIEQRIWFSNPTHYPFTAINRVVFYKASNYEDEDMVGSTLSQAPRLPYLARCLIKITGSWRLYGSGLRTNVGLIWIIRMMWLRWTVWIVLGRRCVTLRIWGRLLALPTSTCKSIKK